MRICYAHIKINKESKEAILTKLHEDECLIKTYGNLAIIPSLEQTINKRDDVLNFGEKLLSLNSGISLIVFKEIIYKFVALKKYSLNISEEYLKNYYYNWKNKKQNKFLLLCS